MMEMFVMDDYRMAANDVVINNQVLRLVINLKVVQNRHDTQVKMTF